MSTGSKPPKWILRYRELQAQGMNLAETIRRLNEEFPEHPERESPRFIGPHAEAEHEQDE